MSFHLAAILALSLISSAAAAEPAAAEPETPTVFPLLRIVPKGEARAIAFFSSLFPDCTPEGPVVVRLLSEPKHGRAVTEDATSFPHYEPSAPLAVCNARKVAGKRLVYEADEKYEGADTFRILVINADGSGYEASIKVLVR